jgi:hypothetical protein
LRSSIRADMVRNHTSPFYDEPIIPPDNSGIPYRHASWPTYANDLPNSVRCGRGTFDHAATTETLKVKAGDTLELQQVRASPEDFDQPSFKTLWNCSTGYGACAFWNGMEVCYPHAQPQRHVEKIFANSLSATHGLQPLGTEDCAPFESSGRPGRDDLRRIGRVDQDRYGGSGSKEQRYEVEALRWR